MNNNTNLDVIDNRVEQHEEQEVNCVNQHNNTNCSHIYKRANKKKNIIKGDRCDNKSIIAAYTSDGNGGYFCRSHAQNKDTYKTKKRENAKVSRKGKKKTNKKTNKITTRSSTRSTRSSTSSSTICTRSSTRSTSSLNNNTISNVEEVVGIEIASPLQDDEQIEIEKKLNKQKDRELLVYMHANCNVSANACEKISETLFENGKMISKLSRNTVVRDTVVQAIKCDILCAEILTISESLGIGIDEASKSDGRSNLEVEIFGRVKLTKRDHWYISLKRNHIKKINDKKKGDNKLSDEEVENLSLKWTYVLCTQEIYTKKGSSILEVFLKRFNEILGFQANIGTVLRSSLFDLKYVSADWTSGNYGKENGFIALLKKERKIVWENLKNLDKKESNKYSIGNFDELQEIGCGDHLINLNFKHIQSNIDKLVSFAKCNTFAYVKNLYKTVTGLQKTQFKGFFRVDCNTKPPSFGRMSENRYGSFYIGSLSIYNNLDNIEKYCNKFNISKKFKKEEFFGNNSKEELFFMSMVAKNCLLPYMKEVNKVESVKQYSTLNNGWIEKMIKTLESKEEFTKFWEIEGERKTELQKIFEKNKKTISNYLKMVQNLEKNTISTRITQQNNNFFCKKIKIEDDIKHYYISFCLFIEFACEQIYLFQQKKIEATNDTPINCGTNRSGERVNASVRKQFDKNSNTNCITIESILKVKDMFPAAHFHQSYENRYKKRNFHIKMSKKCKKDDVSYKSLARKRIEENKLSEYQKKKYELKLEKELLKKLQIQSSNPKETQTIELAEKIYEIIIENLEGESSNPSQLESQTELDSNEDSETSSSSDEYLEESSEGEESPSTIFNDLVNKVSVENLKKSLSFLLSKSFVVQIQNKKSIPKLRDDIIDLFIEKATEFLEIEDKSCYFKVPIIEKTIRSKKGNCYGDDVEDRFKKWIHNDDDLKNLYKEEELNNIKRCSVNTLISFATCTSKREFIKLLKKRFSKK